MHDVVIRPMREEDVVGADRVCSRGALHDLLGRGRGRAGGPPARAHPPSAGTDPGGSWVAEHDGRVAGVGLALIREGVWGFSLFGVAQELQGTGVGRELFARCWEYGAGARGHLVLSSTNPQAMGIYAHTGVPIRPVRGRGRHPRPLARARRGRHRRRGRGGDRGGRRHRPRAARRGPRARPAGADGPRRAAARLRGPRLCPGAREQCDPARRPRRAGRPAHALWACSSAAHRAPR